MDDTWGTQPVSLEPAGGAGRDAAPMTDGSDQELGDSSFTWLLYLASMRLDAYARPNHPHESG